MSQKNSGLISNTGISTFEQLTPSISEANVLVEYFTSSFTQEDTIIIIINTLQ